jgi:prepilin-type N-terminal cleavage/methylation domain-containing protein
VNPKTFPKKIGTFFGVLECCGETMNKPRMRGMEDGYSLLECLLVLAVLLTISGLGAWKFMEALQAVSSLLALLK